MSLARTDAGSSNSNGDDLMRAATEAEKQGLASAIAIYRAGAIRTAINRGDIAAADSFWSASAWLEQKYLADSAWRRDAQLLLMAHARLSLAEQDPAAAAEKIQQAVNLVSAQRQGPTPTGLCILVYPGADRCGEVRDRRPKMEATSVT